MTMWRLPSIEDIDQAPVDVLPAVVAGLAALTSRVAARMMTETPRSPNPPPAPPEQTTLTQEEAAARYRIPLRTMRRLTRCGRVPSYQQGRNRMIRPTDLEQYLARCRDQGVKVGTRLDA